MSRNFNDIVIRQNDEFAAIFSNMEARLKSSNYGAPSPIPTAPTSTSTSASILSKIPKVTFIIVPIVLLYLVLGKNDNRRSNFN